MMKKVLCMLLAVVMLISFAACGGGSTKQEGKTQTASTGSSTDGDSTAPKDTLEVNAYIHIFGNLKIAENDVVTPYVEKKFGLKFNDFVPTTTQQFRERFNQWVAADNMPDIIFGSKADMEYAIASGKMADLSQYFDNGMQNWKKYFDMKFFDRFKTDGKMYQIPAPLINKNDPKYKDDPYNPGFSAMSLRVREDLLAKAGYKFKPLAQIKQEYEATGKKPTEADFAIEPAINTPDDLYNMLKKFKELNISVNGKQLIPLSMPGWVIWHFGNIFDFGQWTLNTDGSVDGYMGTPESKKYYQYLNKLYQEKLLDKDFIIQKDDALQSKFATGQVGVGIYFPDYSKAKQQLLSTNPDAAWRVIKWPKEDPNKGYFDVYEGSFWRFAINGNFKDVKRLMDFYDWSLSDEGLDTLTWGPESAGLWEMKDGKRVFKDPEVEKDMLASAKGMLGPKGPQYYGLYSLEAGREDAFYSKAGMLGLGAFMTYNPRSYARSYEPKNVVSVEAINESLSANGYNTDGRASYGDGSAVVNGVGDYFWTKFAAIEVAKLLTPKTQAEFDAAWAASDKQFRAETKYEEAKKNMEEWFKTFGPK